MLPLPASASTPSLAAHLRLVRDSYQRLTGEPLGDPSWAHLEGEALCRAFWEASVVIASHGVEPDPVLNYGNAKALALWEADWESFTSMPSRLTAEPMNREERAAMLARVTADGFIDDYAGIRISTQGRRFKIHRATVWNLLDENGVRHGQAVVFSEWTMLD